ncbi:hypothetical protein [Ferrovibrio terrae]|uniref:hypothetical protein n=1 Tax=Ferrovibrio terrae TaxID=2594003 RepID=UPI003137EF20
MTRIRPQSLRAIFAAPLAIAIFSLVGLVAALLDDGLYDLLSWLGLAVPVAVIVWSLRWRRQ